MIKLLVSHRRCEANNSLHAKCSSAEVRAKFLLQIKKKPEMFKLYLLPHTTTTTDIGNMGISTIFHNAQQKQIDYVLCSYVILV